jgi:hypothetical protein
MTPSSVANVFRVVLLACVAAASLNILAARAQNATTGVRSTAQLEQLVAPIALYPDALLSQTLMASTYPLEVVEAARWSQQNSNVTGQGLEEAMQRQSWDPSVKALTAIPQTLQMMNDRLSWTQELGDAFLAQQQDVLDAVQRLRARADANGQLKSNEHQQVAQVARPAQAAPSRRQIRSNTTYRSMTRSPLMAPGPIRTVRPSTGRPRAISGGTPCPSRPARSRAPRSGAGLIGRAIASMSTSTTSIASTAPTSATLTGRTTRRIAAAFRIATKALRSASATPARRQHATTIAARRMQAGAISPSRAA